MLAKFHKAKCSQCRRCSVTIETPKGSRNRIKYDPSRRQFKLSKVMPEGMMFPYDFGFVPLTKADDGDPLDVLVLTDEPLFPGCLVECSLIGVPKAEQKEERHTNRNDRLIAVANQSLLYSGTKTLKDLNPKILQQVEEFFVNYQKVCGIEVRILGHAGSREALKILTGATDIKKAA
ncbi:MAG: inorganic pyrophosphatase [Acidobacteria bacterium]|nr:MAG: inorganic pyrophosphatase [Acidobacteriota bacterium]PYX44817.1 MAG: inorganic pyrophosphatase [Acidobacteriota bacterium]